MLRLLQLSDCHLRANADNEVAGRAPARTLADLAAQCAPLAPAAVILSGDLVDEPEPAAFAALDAALAPLGGRRFFLPGNHDDPQAMARHWGAAVVRGGHWETLHGLHLALLDSHWPGQVAGRVGEGQLNWLTARLAATEGPVLVALHHPPVPVGSAWIDALGLADRDAFLQRLAPHAGRIRAIVFGHVHQAFHGRVLGIPCYGAPSTWRQFAPCRPEFAYDDAPPGACLFTWDGQTLTRRCLWLPS